MCNVVITVQTVEIPAIIERLYLIQHNGFQSFDKCPVHVVT